jgi:Dolichyl-phosphate-mannose-protein mannosyltransferase
MHVEAPRPVIEPTSSPAPAVHPQVQRARPVWTPVLIVAGLTLLAAALRFYRLGMWGMDSDEVFMQRDSIHLRFTNPRPLMYALNHYVVQRFVPLDELGIRLLPALAGVLAIPAFFLVVRRMVGARAALFGALLIATSALLVYYSQFGRYWTLVFLLSSIYPYALYLALHDSDGRMLAWGIASGILAVFAHPVSVLLLGGLGLWLVSVYLKREQLANLWSRRSVRWGMLVVVLLGAVIALRFVPMLQQWISEHDKVPLSERGGEFLLHRPGGRSVKQVLLLLAYVVNLTPPLVLAGVLGIYLLWRDRDRALGLLLVYLFCFQVGFIALVQVRTAVSTFYLIPAIPVLFIGAGVFLDRLIGIGVAVRPSWLVPTAVTLMILAAGTPTLVSQYRDGQRWDFRGAARWLEGQLEPGDIVYSDQPQVMLHYLPGRQVYRLVADSTRLGRAARLVPERGGEALWIVAPAPSHAFRTNPKLSSLNDWMYENCQLRNTIGVGRVDFRQNFLQVYRCPPLRPVPAAAGRPAAAPDVTEPAGRALLRGGSASALRPPT